MAQLVVPTGTFSRMRDVDVNRLLASRSLESTEGSPKNPNILGEIVRIVRIRSHGSVGSTYWPMYITTSSLPGSASGSTKFRGLPHLLPEESVDRPVMKSPSGSPNSPTFRGCKTTWSHGSVGRPYWLMYITTSALPGSASGSTKFRGLPHLPSEESVDRTVMKSPSGSPNSPTFRGCKTIWSHGSVGRAHRSHRWGHRFESCCDHHAPGRQKCLPGFFLPYRHT